MRLVFAGELVGGFRIDEVKRSFGQAYKVDGERLDAVFAGGRTVIKRAVAQGDVERYVEKFRQMGMQVLVEPADGESRPAPVAAPKTAPAAPAVAAPVAAVPFSVPPQPAPPQPAAATVPPLAPPEAQVTCPNCGERQSMRAFCRSCSTDIARALANKQEELDRARAERLAARNGGRYAPPKSGVAVVHEGTDELPPVMSLSFEGRMGRIAYFNTGMLSLLGIALIGIGAAVLLPIFRSATVVVPLVLAFAAFGVWAMRVSAIRLHDLNRSGWWALVLLIPYLGSVVSLAMMFWPGTDGDNDYGPQPRQGNGVAATVMGVLLVLMLGGSLVSYRSYTKRLGHEAAEAQGQEQFDPRAAQAAEVITGPAAQQAFTDEYLPQPNHKAFASSDSGAFGWRSGQGSPREAARQALSACEANRKPYTEPCQLINVNGQWLTKR
ncbi:hypothetical protein ASE08_02990 [Rhizobacter sp. Root16D2]|nr:hypothetical protein ASC88_21020 [Rhizobacter sp. Root29]KQW16039.1 hypothetical protein ASC98_02240 [Rhizobacter sp. Root1238]KRB25157.1 hypothetical protein ASE08_02990 [Rhizobacter sp. Root16D2]